MDKQAIVDASVELLKIVHTVPHTDQWRAFLEAVRNEFARQVAFDAKRAEAAAQIIENKATSKTKV